MTDIMVPSKRVRTSSSVDKFPEYSENHDAWDRQMGQVNVNNFLEVCRFCKKKLPANDDVFMYGYLGAFCKKECRAKQMACDILRERWLRDNSTAKKGRLTKCDTKPKEKEEEEEAAPPRFYI